MMTLPFSESLYRLLVQNMPNMAIILFDTSLRYLSAEGFFTDGTTDFVGKTLFEVLPAESVQVLEPYYLAALAGNKSSFERSVNGYTYHADVLPVPDEFGNIWAGMIVSHDITEQKRTELALRQSEERFQLLARATNDAIWDWDLISDAVWWNAGAQTLFGYTPAEVGMGSQWWKANIHPGDAERIVSGIQELIESGEQFWSAEYRYRCADGSYVTVFDRGYILHEDEKPVRMIGAMLDISRRKQAEEALAEEHNLLRTLIDQVPDCIFVKDTEERYIVSNLAHAQAAGVASPDDLIGAKAEQNFPLELADQFAADDEVVLHAGQSLINVERATIDAQGNQRHVLTTKVPLRNASGQIRGLIGISRDITERERIEEALRESEALYRGLFNEIADAIIIHTLEGQILDVNQVTCERLGYTHAELIAMTTFDIDSPEFAQDFGRRMQRQLSEGTLHNLKGVHRTRDGRFIDVEINSSVITYSGQQVVLKICHDITDRKRAQQQALQLATQQERVKTLQAFIQDASHDLNTPITSLMTGSYVLRKLGDQMTSHVLALGTVLSIEHPLGEEMRQTVKKLAKQTAAQETAVLRLKQLVADLLKVTQLDRNPKYNFMPHDLNAVVTLVLQACSPLAANKNITLNLETEVDLPQVTIDENELSRAVENMVSNAIQYTPINGTILVSLFQSADEVGLKVIDNGLGISSSDLPHIFERFYRADRARSTNTGGSGLGLAIAKMIVEAHRGRIEVSSEVGQGSAFTLLLPLPPNVG